MPEAFINIQRLTAVPAIFISAAWVWSSRGSSDGVDFIVAAAIVYIALEFIEFLITGLYKEYGLR